MARIALTGRRQDILLHLRRLVRRHRNTAPEFCEQLLGLLQEQPSGESPMRNSNSAMVPLDEESRLQLARVEEVVELDTQPIWPAEVSAALDQFVAEREQEHRLLEAGVTASNTILMTGPPGTGKTLAARWLAREIGRPLLTLDLTAVMSSFLGKTGMNTRHVLDYAKGTPSVLLLDEFDAIAKRRDDEAEIGELKRLVTVLLQEIDDWPPSGILVAATNHSELLDPAVWRRFDLVVQFPLPSATHVRQLASQILAPHANVKHAYLHAMARAFQGRSFADVKRLCEQMLRRSLVHGTDLSDEVYREVSKQASQMSSAGRIELAVDLVRNCSLSQRETHRLTGVSRDTIRKRTA
ncbi:MAG: ATP-binding protein [Candidatus Brocadiia bacterium]